MLSHGLETPQPVKAFFSGGVSSTHWIRFEGARDGHIYVPATVDGHKVLVSLANGIPDLKVDKDFAASIHPDSVANALNAAPLSMTITYDNLTLRGLSASTIDLSSRRANSDG